MPHRRLPLLEEILSYKFRNMDLLIEAITHKSFLNELKSKKRKDNERLEFLGDAVLDLVMSEYLIGYHVDLPEGELSKMKARIVSKPTLSRVATRLQIGNYLLLGKGEEHTHGRNKSSLLADSLEAIIAAIYLDGGLEAAKEFLLDKFEEEMKELFKPELSFDYKTELQEICQQDFETLPSYSITGEHGPDHQKVFEVELTIKDRLFGRGSGKSKKEAEQMAAKEALERLKAP
ncbi:MAG TPA: ribonuclease III [Nitrospiria bacterium]|nr:ribonuclease III [Nitrospiria bacterium]